MALIHSDSQRAIGQNIRTERHAGKPEDQAIAIAESVAHDSKGVTVGANFDDYNFPLPTRYQGNQWTEYQFPMFQEPLAGGDIKPDVKMLKFTKEITSFETKSTFDKPIFDDDKLYIRFVISTDALDRDGDIVIPEGCDLSHCKNYLPVFLNHGTKSPFPIGSAIKDGKPDVQVYSDRVEAGCLFNRETPEAVTAYNLIKMGQLKGASVGFMADPMHVRIIQGREAQARYGRPKVKIIDHWWLHEFSITGIPCNQEALVIE